MCRFRCAAIAAAAVFGFTSIASAADLPVKAPADIAPAAYNWTGFYIGGNVGYGWQDPTASFTPNGLNLALIIGSSPPISFNISGSLGGLQLGYNWKFNQNWVVGFEADFDFSKIKGNGAASYTDLGGILPFNSNADEQVKWFGTARARLGYLPTSNLLVYGTGGVAYGKVEQNASIANPISSGFVSGNEACSGFSICYTGSSSRTATGWTAGAGAEYAFMNNLTFKAEYLFVNLGSNSFTANLTSPGTSSVTINFSQTTFNVVRFGVNYRF